MYDISDLNKYDQNHRMVIQAQQRIENIMRHYSARLDQLEEREKKIRSVVGSVVVYFEEAPQCVRCGKALPVSSISSGAKVCSTCYHRRKVEARAGEGSPFYVCTLYGAEGEKIADYGSTERHSAVAAVARTSLVGLVYGLPEGNPVRYLVVDQNLRSLIDGETSWEYQGLRVTIEEKRIF